MKVIKRNGAEVEFDKSKIVSAISRANNSTEEDGRISSELIEQLAANIENKIIKQKRAFTVEEIQDLVQNELIKKNAYKLVKNYITYRYERELARKQNTTDSQIMSLIECNNEEAKQENSNKNPVIVSTQRDYMAGTVSKDITRRILLPKDISDAHDNGIIHFHDADYFAQHIHNCDLVNLEDMLQNGTVISGTKIEKPHSFATACNIATQIIAQVASSQYGGQSVTLSHLAPFVNITREKIRREVEEEVLRFVEPGVKIDIPGIVEKRLLKEIERGVQTIQYQINTIMTTNGQTPFVTVFMYLNEVKDEQTKKDLALIIEEVLKQRIQGTKNETGIYVTPAFPKLIYVLEEDNVHPDSKYYYLTYLAARCTAKRLVPDYISEKKMMEIKEGHCFPAMGCRSFLSPWKQDPTKYYGRFNKGVVTINLIDVACSAKGKNYEKDMESFWSIFDERLELCHRALLCRYERLKGTLSDVAPILWQYGAISRLKKGETIDSLLTGGYSTISLGYAGLWETTIELIGKNLLDPEGKDLGIKILKHMNAKCKEWNDELDLGFGIYGTPLESTTYKFAKTLQQRFGEISEVTDHNYITNSYHVCVRENIDAFSKLAAEAEFQNLSTGGAISYVEVPDLQKNIEAVMAVIEFIYDNIMYAELNTKSDFCEECGFDGEIQIVEEDGKLIWKCPNCGNTNQDKMSVVRRTCGYLGSNFWNQGRTAEIKDRVLHL